MSQKINKILIVILYFLSFVFAVIMLATTSSALTIPQYDPSTKNKYYATMTSTWEDDLKSLGYDMKNLPFTHELLYNKDDGYESKVLGIVETDPNLDGNRFYLYLWNSHYEEYYGALNNVELTMTINDVEFEFTLYNSNNKGNDEWTSGYGNYQHPYKKGYYDYKKPYANFPETVGENVITEEEWWNGEYDVEHMPNAEPGDPKYLTYGVECYDVCVESAPDGFLTTDMFRGENETTNYSVDEISYDFNTTVAKVFHGRWDLFKDKYPSVNRIREYAGYSIQYSDLECVSGGACTDLQVMDYELLPYNYTYTAIAQTKVWHQTVIDSVLTNDLDVYFNLKDLTTGLDIYNATSITFNCDLKYHDKWYQLFNPKWHNNVCYSLDIEDSFFKVSVRGPMYSFYECDTLDNKFNKNKYGRKFDYKLAASDSLKDVRNFNYMYCTYYTVGVTETEINGSFYEDGAHPVYDVDGNLLGIYDLNGNVIEEYLCDDYGRIYDVKTGEFVIAKHQYIDYDPETINPFSNLLSKFKDVGDVGRSLIVLFGGLCVAGIIFFIGSVSFKFLKFIFKK